MEVHRQTCQNCGSIDVRNLLAREPGRAQAVYVRCAKCGHLVARYRIDQYYHHGKGAESFLRSVGARSFESGRAKLADFEEAKREATAGFEAVLEALRESGRDA